MDNSALNLVPDEIIYHVLTFLFNSLDIYNVSLTCKRMYYISNDTSLVKIIKSIHNSFEDYGFNYPGCLWYLPMLGRPTFLNFKEQLIRSANLFGEPAIMIEEESKNIEKLDDLALFAGRQKHFNHIEKIFSGYSGERILIRYYFKVPKKWYFDFKNIKTRSKHNHLKISKDYKKRILKRYPNINLETF